jgi:type VI secretion system protein ImpE
LSAEERFKSGDLTGAIAAQVAAVKSKPADPDERFFLVGLLAFAGERDRAITHLDVLSRLDKEYVPLSALFRSLLEADEERKRVHQGEHRPGLPSEGAADTEQRLALAAALAAQDLKASREIVSHLAEAEPVRGELNGQGFESITNTDDVLGPTLEVFAGGRCLWLPLANVRRLTVREPRSILDLLWKEAELADSTGAESVVHLPTRYVGSEDSTDDNVRLGRATEWADVEGLVFRGSGQNTFEYAAQGAGVEEIPLLEIRKLEVHGS